MRSILLVALLIAPVLARAEWVRLGEDKEIQLTVYVDPGTLSKNGQFRRIRVLLDSGKRNRDGSLSELHEEEYDCQRNRFRFLSFTMHSERMAGGKVIRRSNVVGKWYKPFDTSDNSVIKFVCAQ